MSLLLNGIKDGLDLILSGNGYIWNLIWVTLKVAVVSTCIGLAVGIPTGLAVGLGGGSRGRRRGFARQALSNAGLGLPPVVVGIVLSLLMFPDGPLGGLRWLYTLKGVYLAQTLLAFPVAVALVAAAVRALPPGLLAQARALGASTPQVWILALREARIGVAAAVIAALGSALSEVGAVVLVGGNIPSSTETLASAALTQVNAGHYGTAMAIGMLLLGLLLLLASLLTLFQLRDASRRPVPA